MLPVFEKSGWSRVDISSDALNAVEVDMAQRGLPPERFNLAPHLEGYKEYLKLPEYSGEYRVYGGQDHHCLLEKSLEHYLSVVLIAPRPGQVAIDIGSCQSVVPVILRRVHNIHCYEQDLVYAAGIAGDKIGSSADAIPLPDTSIDFMTLHCTFEHFERDADTGFVKECARLLKPGGRTVILPLYLNANHCNVTGESNPASLETIGFDQECQFRCIIPEWQNRFGRHYSPAALFRRVIIPARAAGLQPRLLRCENWGQLDSRLWLRWILVLEQPLTTSPHLR